MQPSLAEAGRQFEQQYQQPLKPSNKWANATFLKKLGLNKASSDRRSLHLHHLQSHTSCVAL